MAVVMVTLLFAARHLWGTRPIVSGWFGRPRRLPTWDRGLGRLADAIEVSPLYCRGMSMPKFRPRKAMYSRPNSVSPKCSGARDDARGDLRKRARR